MVSISNYLEFLKRDDFLKLLLETIESEKEFLFLNLPTEEKISRSEESLKGRNDATSSKKTLIDMFVYLIISINKKFTLPEENLLVNLINSNQEIVSNRKCLSESVINLFNFESIDFLFFYYLLIVVKKIEFFFNL